MSEPKFTLSYIPCECYKCNKEYMHCYQDNLCDACFMNEIENIVTEKQSSRMTDIKFYTYSILFMVVPVPIIYCYLGSIPSLVFSFTLTYGILISSIINWCMRKF